MCPFRTLLSSTDKQEWLVGLHPFQFSCSLGDYRKKKAAESISLSNLAWQAGISGSCWQVGVSVYCTFCLA
jgi:hypothetical protein